jgi:hypothetical protein
MEQFKASEEDWQQIECRAKNYSIAEVSRAVCELRDRVAALEAERVAPVRVPSTEPTPPPPMPSAGSLWEARLHVYKQGLAAGYQQGLVAGRAEQGSSQGILDDSTPEPEPTHPQYFSSHHAIAGEIWEMLPDAPEPSQAPAGDGGLVEGIRGLLGHQFDRVATNTMARAVLLAVAQWLRSMGRRCAATELEREARR